MDTKCTTIGCDRETMKNRSRCGVHVRDICLATLCKQRVYPGTDYCRDHLCTFHNCYNYKDPSKEVCDQAHKSTTPMLRCEACVPGVKTCASCAGTTTTTNQKCTYNGCMKNWYMNFRCYEHMQMPGPPKPTTPTETNKHFLCPCGKIPLMGYTFCKACMCKYDNCAKERVITTHYCRDHQTQYLYMECVDREKCNHVEHLVEMIPGERVQIDRPCDICSNEMCLAHELVDKIQYDANVTQLFVKIFDHVRNCKCRKGLNE